MRLLNYKLKNEEDQSTIATGSCVIYVYLHNNGSCFEDSDDPINI